MNHYVYRITDLRVNRHYIGVRSCSCLPEDDIGVTYFSSSKNRDFVNDQRKNRKFFKYKIIRKFDNRYDAVNFEIKIHSKLDVASNPAFFNKARQTNSKFSAPGMISVNGNMMTIQEYIDSGLRHHRKDWRICTDNSGKIFHAHKNDERFLNSSIWSASLGLVRAINENGEKIIVTKEEYHSGRYTCNNTGKVPAIDPDGKGCLISREEYASGSYVHVSHGLITAVNNRTKEYCSVTVEEFNRGGYQGVNKGKVSKDKNPNAKLIYILDATGDIKFICHGNFKQTCLDNGLPFAALRNSYQCNGSPIFSSKKTKSDAARTGKLEFINWKAIIQI